jgi:hypothetical protein
MSFDYPQLYCLGIVPFIGAPMPIYGGVIPSIVPIVGGNQWVFPSSLGGWDTYLNVFAVGQASFYTPTVQPWYGWSFGFVGTCASPVTLPSGYSIWEFVWMSKGSYNQYLLLSGDENDCLGGRGNKGRNYSIISDADNGYLWYWNNDPDPNSGVSEEWGMCLWLCDTITIPFNFPGTDSWSNPFGPSGPVGDQDFDVGSPTLTPFLSSGCVHLGFYTHEYTGTHGTRIPVGSFFPGSIPFGLMCHRLPHGWGPFTNIMLALVPTFNHTPGPYPACMWGSTNAAKSVAVPFPPDPGLYCAEIWFSSLATGKDPTNNAAYPPSAGYKATYF